ncbi:MULTISPECIES: DNA-formamidopyrimidine glycosylase [Vagococcus]|uniref:Formamidopyrimidine-DNA glycosylase n=1 Tax=Vagococcus fluvialis bH819 TaxID=1255619 RepID=A0A1X6WNM0_9ENTE|nr:MULTISPECIES: DNA-formamidopyrimidine glycosylase [Vagococcus]SLM85869.1 Formamidopyrimidine-DNA glycosylase [Vagococcus fluvialis bH819]HCM90290.1 DNA-formamidopyrimidine glycosylase [Vagococcus sp.]
MPELPEVETVRKGLENLVKGKTIENVAVYWPRIIETPFVDEFKINLIGETIENVERRGKYLIFKLTHFDMISHLRMEGKFEYHSSEDALLKHSHVVFHFNDNTELRYLDVRKFGRFVLFPKDTANEYKGLKKLGPEPVASEFDLTMFMKELKKKKKSIKPLLLDQILVTGLGNIYVDEALFRAQIHPEQEANTLNQAEVKRLHREIIAVLGEAVEAGGTTIRSYKNALGDAGSFQVSLLVYGQNGESCPRCGSEILKKKVAQRGTHYCPICQVYHKRKGS